MVSRTPQLAELLNAARVAWAAGLHVSMPARVERYDSARQLADVQPLVRDTVEGEDGQLQALRFPVIPNVPVVFPGGGGLRVLFPVAAGDTVLLVFSDRSLDAWQDQGGESAPVDQRRHHLTDAVAIPGLHANPSPWTGAQTAALSIGVDAGTQALIGAGSIKLGSAAAVQASVRGTAYRVAEDTLLLAIQTCVAGLAPLTTNPTAAAALVATMAAAFTAFASASAGFLSTVVTLD